MDNLISFYPISAINKNFPYLYVLDIAGTKILSSQGFPFEDLLYLNVSDNYSKRVKTEVAQNQYFKVDQDFVYMNNTCRFDMQFLHHIDFTEISHYLVCSSDDLLLLQYLIQHSKFNAQIICTQALYQLGTHIVKEFFVALHDRNRHFQDNIQEDYFKETTSFQVFEDAEGRNFQEFNEIPQLRQIKCTLTNFGQLIKIPLLNVAETLIVEVLPNGCEVGGAAYKLHFGNSLSILMAPQLNVEDSVSRSLEFHKLNADYAILGRSTVQQPLTEFASNVRDILSKGKNVVIPFQNPMNLLNLQDLFDDEFQHKCYKIFIISTEFHKCLQLANSNVEYLNLKLQENILKENPVNPLIKLMSLIKAEKIIIRDTVQELKFENLTLQSTLAQSTPSMYFIYDSTLRLGQARELFELLESISQSNQISIYTMKIADQSFNFAIIFTELFQKRLISQIADKYNCHIINSPIRLQSPTATILPYIQAKQFLIYENIPGLNIVQYKMLQKINLKFNYLTVPLKMHITGISNKSLCNIELSQAKLKLSDHQSASLNREPYQIQYIQGNISDSLLEINDKIVQYFNWVPQIRDMEITYYDRSKQIQAILNLANNDCVIVCQDSYKLDQIEQIIMKSADIRQF